jgi:hypothetical protein
MDEKKAKLKEVNNHKEADISKKDREALTIYGAKSKVQQDEWDYKEVKLSKETYTISKPISQEIYIIYRNKFQPSSEADVQNSEKKPFSEQFKRGFMDSL